MVHIRNPDKLFLHKSGLTSFRKCPLKFSYMYVHMVEADIPPEMEFGREFHDTARKFNYLYEANVLFGIKTYKDRYSYMVGCIPECSPTIYDWMLNYVRVEVDRSFNFKLDIPMFKPVVQEKYYESEEHRYAGTIDRIDWYDWDTLMVVDYKPRVPKQLSLLRQEMAIYWVLANSESGLKEPINHWGVIGYKEGEVYTEEIKAATLRALKRNTLNVWKAVEDDEFPPKPGEHCQWCQFGYHCTDVFLGVHEEAAGKIHV